MTFAEVYQKYLDENDPDYHLSMESLFKWFYDSAFKWQPIASGRSEQGKIVLICIETEQLKRQIPLRAVWYDRFTEEDNYNENEATEYCEDRDAYFVREGWYEFNQCDEVNWGITDTVTHWAEIPLPPVA